MARCRHFRVCGKEGDELFEDVCCILHSYNKRKDPAAFLFAFLQHQESRGDNYSFIVFPLATDFTGRTFEKAALFVGAVFRGAAKFDKCVFKEEANFSSDFFRDFSDIAESRGTTVFEKDASFFETIFERNAVFDGTRFQKRATFLGTIFRGRSSFTAARFSDVCTFQKSAFHERTSFYGTHFDYEARFSEVTFRAKTVFVGSCFKGFSEPLPDLLPSRVDFSSVSVEEDCVLEFRGTDLSCAVFSHTDLTHPQFIDVRWARSRGMNCVYDELKAHKDVLHSWNRVLQRGIPWGDLEQLYRALKQNYEDRRDYGRAGDFHYREKQMRKRNPSTTRADKALLWLYWGLSGYSERIWPSIAWLLAMIIACAFVYLLIGVRVKEGGETLHWGFKITGDWRGFVDTLLYSARTSFFLKPEDLVISSAVAKLISLLQTVLSPILLGLLGLAIRQRMKR